VGIAQRDVMWLGRNDSSWRGRRDAARVCVCEKGRRASPDGERVLAAQSRFSAEPSGSVMEGKNWGTAETLHLDWEIFHFVSQMQRCSERERWCDVTRPPMETKDMNEGEMKVFVSCLIFSIIFMIVFAGAVSYLYVLFKNYLDSLA